MTTRWEVFKVDAYYVALPFLPVAPKIGDPRDADSILSQAYGRNDYTDEELPDIIAEVRALGMHNDHMTMGVLKQRGFRPGVPNLALADRCITLAKLYGLPIYAQWEVAYGIFDLDPDWYFQNKERITALWPDQGYFALYHIAVKAAALMSEKGLNRPIYIGNPAMTTRAIPSIWAVGLEPIVEPVSILDIMFGVAPLFVFDGESIQSWTRSWRAGVVREVKGHYGHLFAWAHYRLGCKDRLDRYPFPPNIRKMVPGDWARFTPPSWSERTPLSFSR